MKKPNILILMNDQHHAGCFEYAGHPDVKTPNIDRLAADGVNFRNAFCQNGISVPSRVSLITGQYPSTHGVFGSDTMGIPASLISLPAYLQNFGYQTAMIGKKHMPNWPTHGFQYERLCYHADAPVRELHYYNYLKKHNLHAHYDELGDVEKFTSFDSPIPNEHSMEVWTANEAINYLRTRDRSKPFIAEVSFERPHPPLSPSHDCPFSYDPDALTLPENRRENIGDSPFYFNRNVELKWSAATHGEQVLRQALARYYSLITLIDQQIGRIVESLKETGDLENTIIIFTADHGDFAGEYSRMAKGWSYDAICRIPMIVHFPQRFAPAERIDELIEQIDIFPTLCDLLDIHVPRAVQGKSLLPVLDGVTAPERDTVFFEYATCKTVRTREYKLNYGFDGEKGIGELFDLRNDPHEYENLFNSPAYRDVRETLIRRLLDWQLEIQQPVNWQPADTNYPSTRWFNNPTR
ncbi:MAG: sulfatase-like hydrolase/transferase [Kiritimatiellales bacterium]